MIAFWSYSLTGMIDLSLFEGYSGWSVIVIAFCSYSLTGMIDLVYLMVILAGVCL